MYIYSYPRTPRGFEPHIAVPAAALVGMSLS